MQLSALSESSSSQTVAAERPGLLQVCVGSERIVMQLQKAYPVDGPDFADG